MMTPLDYFKLQAKNLLKDYKTKKTRVDEVDGEPYSDYAPKYFDIDRIFVEYDWDEDDFGLMKAQHLFALMLGFGQWAELLKATDEELELAKIVWDNQHKIELQEWQDYIARAEAENEATFDTITRIAIFEKVFVEVDGHENPLGDYRLSASIGRLSGTQATRQAPSPGEKPNPVSSTDLRSFGEWLLQQTDRDDVVGDLAQDVRRDQHFPKSHNIDKIISHLSGKGSHVRSALAEAILDWRKLQRS